MDLSEFQPTSAPWRQCLAGHVIAGLDDEKHATVAEAMRSISITSKRIAEVLSKWTEQNVPVASVRRHRRGECTCD